MTRLLHIFLLCALLAACDQKQETEQPTCVPTTTTEAAKVAAPKIALQKVGFDELPGWEADQFDGAARAFELNCTALAKAKGDTLGRAEVKVDRAKMQQICTNYLHKKPADFKAFVKAHFEPYAVEADGKREGKFTSYFESMITASTSKHDKYQSPIYGLPLDLIEFNPHDFNPALPSQKLVGRVKKNKLIPYYSRSEIMDDPHYAAKAPVILWADSYVDVYVMQIQGSAIANLDDGRKVRVGYAATNGLPFKGIGSILLEKKLLQPGQASMGKIKKWLTENFEQAYPHMNDNKRYVFHRLIENDGPIGAQNVPLTPGRSLAVDTAYVPLGALLWLDTKDGSHEIIQKLVFAQDIGGAIKGAIRGDYFWGSGGDEVLEHAGKMNSVGKYYVLLPQD